MVRREMSTEQVQRWVVTVLIFAVTAFPLGALTAAVVTMAEDRRSSAVVLVVMMAVIGMLSLGACRLVHRRSPVSVVLLLGVIPAAVVAIIAF